MLIKVSKASGVVLDWLVATCEQTKKDWLMEGNFTFARTYGEFTYSTDWAQGGPIIEREEIGIKRRAPCMRGEEWEAMGSVTAKGAGYRHAVGPTPLIAAMRCYVASKLGEEVEVPEELCS